MTLNEISYNILNLIRGGRSHHDDHISLAQIKFNVKHYRAVQIRRDYVRNGQITRHLEQDLGCVKLIEVDAAKCCNLNVGCTVFRTVKTIPKTIRFNFKEAITHVGGIDGISTIPFIESHMIPYLEYDKYTKDKAKSYMIGDYLYIYNPGTMEYINIRGIFEDPETISSFDCDGVDCYDDNSEFPLPMDMLQSITAGLMNGELAMLATTMSDTTNDRMQEVTMPKGGGKE